NTYLKENSKLWNENFVTLHALNQTNGKGRFERKWYSEKGLDLTFSTLFLPNEKVKNLSVVSLYAGLAVYNVLIKQLDENLNLKWPNDIYYKDKKLGGILCENICSNNKQVVIIGIGINVNSLNNSEKILDNNITSVKEITNINYNIDFILNDILKELRIYLNNSNFPLNNDVLNEWKNASTSIGKKVLYEQDGEQKNAVIIDINNNSSLALLDEKTNKKINFFGEIIFK
ncbi:MAG: biotin--[acetyl-CoA-carboxylase] ligase, partial [Desulfobacterales bacterium]|nr:biotin--[acetyl-CoA-carboxylase] ligase [Desulfobacterales bacterium]